MKNAQQQVPDNNPRFNAKKKRAENKDNLDSREGEEQQFKGDDVPHNRKAQQSRKSSENRKAEKGRQ